jgi:predicted ATPase with chaperone activity
VRDRVLVAVDRQQQRNRRCPAWPNGRLRDAALEDAVGTSDDIRHAVEDVLRIHSMSGRARVRLLRIARTIADLDDRDNVLIPDIHAAARLRGYGSII